MAVSYRAAPLHGLRSCKRLAEIVPIRVPQRPPQATCGPPGRRVLMVRSGRRLVGFGLMVACLLACEPHPARLVQHERRGVRAAVGEPGCDAIALPNGATTQTFAGMGLSGWRRVRTIFSDGRVTQDDSSRPPRNGLRVSVARLRKLDADLVATGLFDRARAAGGAVTMGRPKSGVTTTCRPASRFATMDGRTPTRATRSCFRRWLRRRSACSTHSTSWRTEARPGRVIRGPTRSAVRTRWRRLR